MPVPPRRTPPSTAARVAVADELQPEAARPRVREPVWLVRIVLLLFLAGFASFLARQMWNFWHSF